TGPAGNGSSLAAAGSVVIAGGGLSSNVTVSLAIGDNLTSTANKIQSALDNAAAQGAGPGKFVVDTTGGAIRIRSNILRSRAVTATSDSVATQNVVGFLAATSTGNNGAALTVTVNGQATTVTAGSQALNNQVTYGGNNGLSFSVNVANGS